MSTATSFNGISLCISLPQDSYLDFGCAGGSHWCLKSQFTQLVYTDYVSLFLSRSGVTSEVTVVARLALNRSSSFSQLVWECSFSTSFAKGQTEAIILTTYNVAQYSPELVYICGNITIHHSASSNVLMTDICLTNGKFNPVQQLSDDLQQLLNNQGPFSDAVLKCDGTEIPVHKCVLSARSSFFSNLFKVQEESAIDITDIDLNVLQVLLRYLYSGKTGDLTASMVGDLLFAAVKYEITELMQICSDKLNSDAVSEDPQ